MFDINDNSLIICNNNIKKNILLSMSKNNIIKNIKFITLKDFIDNYFGTYDINTIYFLMNKYHYNYEVAKEYLDNIFYGYESLKDTYEVLNENNLLIFNNHYKDELSKFSNIYVIGYDLIDKYVKDILMYLNAIFIYDQKGNNNPSVFEFISQEEEVNYIIVDIINKHINHLNDVYLVNVSSNYYQDIKRLFKLYNIPVNLNINNSIYSTKIVQEFIKKLYDTKNINESLKIITNNDILNKVIDIINKCDIDKLDDIYIDIIKNELKNTFIENELYDNAVNIIDFDDMVDKDKYYYILNFNQGYVPKVYHDDDFISDEVKHKLGLSTSLEKLLVSKRKVINIINTYPNIFISYKKRDSKQEYIVSPLVTELNLKIEYLTANNYIYSDKYNKLKLAVKLDNLRKYNVIDDYLYDLNTTYKDINYLSYDNRFKKVDYNLLKDYLKNNIRLSYSSMNNYFKCSFRYYINDILKLNLFEDSFQTLIGNLFHYTLSKMYDDNFDLNIVYNDYLKDKKLTAKETFFINKLYKELDFIIKTIRKQDDKSLFKQVLTEKEIEIDKSSDINIKFIGIIDKIKFMEEDNILFASIIDYKTGNVTATLDNINYGLNMQLPVYVYLIKKGFNKDVKIVGFYLQKLLSSMSINKDNEENKKTNLKLHGYTIDNENLIAKFDETYSVSEVISSMKLTQNGISKMAKLINEKDINKIVSIVEENINKVIESIKEGNFEINPKKIDNEKDIIGCKYCQFKDICFKTEKDIKIIKNTTKDEIFND